MTLDDLIEMIREEAIHLGNGAALTSDVGVQQVAVSTLARVPVYVSSAIYSSRLLGGTPPHRVENVVGSGAGICGDHVGVALRVFDAMAIPVRDLQVFYRYDGEELNHTFIEVSWGGSWRLIDVTWGFIPHRGSLDTALSYEEAAREQHRAGLHHSMIPWRIAVEDAFDIFSYLTVDIDLLRFGDHPSGELPTLEGL